MMKDKKGQEMMWNQVGGWVWILLAAALILLITFVWRDQLMALLGQVWEFLKFGR